MLKKIEYALMKKVDTKNTILSCESDVRYPFEKLTGEGVPIKLYEGLYCVRMPLHIGIAHINLYLLEDPRGWYIVDTGIPNQATRDYWIELRTNWFQHKPVIGIICTHYHYDHAGLASFLCDLFDTQLYMTFGEYYLLRASAVEDKSTRVAQQLAFWAQHGMPEDELESVRQANVNDPYIDYHPEQFIRLQHGQTLTIGRRKWQIRIGSGHSPEHACLFSQDCINGEPQLLLSGDQLLPTISSNIFVQDTEPFGNPLAQWFDALDWLAQLPSKTVCMPAHGYPFTGIKSRTRALHAHHRETLSTLLEKAQEFSDMQHGFSAHSAMRWLFPKIHRPVDLMLALSETIAHLNYLVAQGECIRLVCDNPKNETRCKIPCLKFALSDSHLQNNSHTYLCQCSYLTDNQNTVLTENTHGDF